MKKLLQRVFGVVVSAALLVTSGMTAFAAEHNHHSKDYNIASPTDGYTITLTTPSGYVTPENQSSKKFGAYQIFTGTVKDEDYTDPGDAYEKIPITDIKWGNAFGADDTTAKQNIIKFVFALAEAPTGYYKYAFSEFTGFEGFVTDDKLSAEYLLDTSATVTVTKDSATNAIGKDSTFAGDLSKVNFDKLAVKVSDVIADNHNNREWLQSLTDILGGYGEGYKEGNFVSQCYGKNGTLAEDSSSDGTYKYEITVPAGYYMIMDLSTIDDGAVTDDSDAYSARMLFVANDITQKIKESVPTLDKKVLRADDVIGTAGKETDVAGVGDVVHFQLKGTLPSNYDNYLGGYKYIFEDTLSKGLDLVQYDTHADYVESGGIYVNVTVKGLFVWRADRWNWEPSATATIPVKVDSGIVDTDGSSTDVHLKDNDNYTVAYSSRKLEVTFPCLREIRVNGNDDFSSNVCRLGYDTTAAASSEIYVDYYAKVNKDAVVSPASGTSEAERNGNFNTAQIQYSDNPQSYEDMDYTVVDRATVYTFGLDIVKIDAAEFLRKDTYESHENEVGLKDAKFVLVRPTNVDTNGKPDTNTTWEIAKFATVAKNPSSEENLPKFFKDNGYYTITEWVKIDGAEAKGTTFNEEWLTDDRKADTGGYVIKSLDKGILNVSGLDVDREYTMVETATPDDTKYAKIAPFTFILKAQSDEGTKEYDGILTTGTNANPAITGEKSFSFDKYVQMIDPIGEKKPDTDGSANMLVANFKYVDLPSTGGVGTYWFYILGAGSLAISFVLFRLSRKKIVQ